MKGEIMLNNSKSYQRHMELDERIYIELALDKGFSFKEIATALKKDPTTIAKEIKKHYSITPKNTRMYSNFCQLRRNCIRKKVCGKMGCDKRCSFCGQVCNSYCTDFVQETCPKLLKPPFVCNACERKSPCRLEKHYYRASAAHSSYRTLLSTSREGINFSIEDLEQLDALVTPLIHKGQSIAQIYAKHQNEISCTTRTLYNYVDSRILTARNIDMPRIVKYKPRKAKKTQPVNHTWKEGRKYSDFEEFQKNHPETSIVEMDTVEGCKGGKVLLTMFFRNSRLMLGFLLPDKSQLSVLNVFNMLDEMLGTILFQKTFSLILTDNGSEFINPTILELNSDDVYRTSIYYCDSNAAYQKGGIEKNHTYIRRIVKKGKPFDSFTQEDITLMMNHINSSARESLNGRTPFELASLLLDKTVLNALKLIEIDPDEIILRKELLKK
jgi:transposase, IS30 family